MHAFAGRRAATRLAWNMDVPGVEGESMLLPVAFAQAVTMKSVRDIAMRPARRSVRDVAMRSGRKSPPHAALKDAGTGGDNLEKPVRTSSYVVRLSAGFGPVMPSAQEDLLDKEHYGGGRWLGIVDAAGRLAGRFLVGGFLAYATRDSTPSHVGGPPLADSIVLNGAEAMLLAGDGACRFPFAARLGYARGAEGFHDRPRWENAPVFGAEAGFMCLHMGVAAGLLVAPAAPPGDLGRSWNMGSFYVSFVGGFYN